MSSCSIYFGERIFEKLQFVQPTRKVVLDVAKKATALIFDSLLVNDCLHVIKNVIPCWSFSLYVLENEIIYCGVKLSETCKLPSALCIHPDQRFTCEEISLISGGFNRVVLLGKNGHCYSLTGDDENLVMKSLGIVNVSGKVKQVVVADDRNIFITEDGLLYQSSGLMNLPQLFALPIKVSEVACGKEHTLILTSSGSIYSYGVGSRGQLGHGDANSSEKPKLIEALDGIVLKQISAGGWHSAALSVYDDVYTWGWNERGQLGRPCSHSLKTNPDSSQIEEICFIPKIVQFPNDVRILKVSLGSRHSAVLLDDHSVVTFGWNGYGQLGRKAATFSDVPTTAEIPPDLVPQDLHCFQWSTVITAKISSEEQIS